MVECILDDTPKRGGPAAPLIPFLIKHYVVIYYLLVILVVWGHCNHYPYFDWSGIWHLRLG